MLESTFWKRIALCLVLVALCAWITGASESFKSCVHTGKDAEPYKTRHESSAGVDRALIRLDLDRLCAGEFTDKNQGSIVALGTVALAVFTFTLWRATTGMLATAHEQSEAMERSIYQSTLAARAMQSVAESMATNVSALKETVATNKEIAARQKSFGEAQMRAYISVRVGEFYPQDRARDAPLQVHPIIVNDGHTPAHDLTFRGRVVVRPFPPGAEFDFSLPPLAEERSVITVGPHQTTSMPFHAQQWYSDEEVAEFKIATQKRVYCYGTVNYKDAFGAEHHTNFCYSTIWSVQGNPMGIWTRRHNDSD
jgi:hypothetical protein